MYNNISENIIFTIQHVDDKHVTTDWTV